MNGTITVNITGTGAADRLLWGDRSGHYQGEINLAQSDVDAGDFLSGIDVDQSITRYFAGVSMNGDQTSDPSDEVELTFTLRETAQKPPPPDISGITFAFTVTSDDPSKEYTVEVV